MNEKLEVRESEDDVLVGSTTNLASSDKNQGETEGTTPKAQIEFEHEEDPNYIEVLNKDWDLKEKK